jgi:hypothetical protein
MTVMYAVVAFALGLGLSYVIFPFPTPDSGDESGFARFVVTACVTFLGYVLGKIVSTNERAPVSSHLDLRDSRLADAGTSSESAPSASQEIKALAELRDRGILTEDEFEAKKRQILGL